LAKVRVRGGTVDHGQPPLCASCRYATIVRGSRLEEEIVGCAGPGTPRFIPFRVVSCSSYEHRDHPTLVHMEDIAFVLRSNAGSKPAGFVHASRLPWSERHVLDED
jgi:hypothetical protein